MIPSTPTADPPAPSWIAALLVPAAAYLILGFGHQLAMWPIESLQPHSAWNLALRYQTDVGLVAGATLAIAYLVIHLKARFGISLWRELSPVGLPPRSLSLASVAGIAVGVVTVGALWVFSRENLQPLVVPPHTPQRLLVMFSILIFGAVTGPLFEEIIFRRLLYLWVRRWLPVPVAILIVSVLFGLGHGWVVNAAPSALLGVVTCLLYERTRSLLTCVIAHTVDTLTIHVLQILIFWPAILP